MRAAVSGKLTSSSTMAASFPPSARGNRLRAQDQGTQTLFEVAVVTVNETFAISGWRVKSEPNSFASTMTLSTPGGRIADASSPKRTVVSGVVAAGFATTVLPVMSAG